MEKKNIIRSTYLSLMLVLLFSFCVVYGAEVILESTDLDTRDHFGISVDISGDNSIIGANFENGRIGSAYIFSRSGTVWNETAKLTAGDAIGQGQLGFSVSIDGNYAAAGAYRADSDTGAVYIFHKDTGGIDNWGQVAKIIPSDGQPGDRFGYAVDIKDTNLIVGAVPSTDTPTTPGYVYIFSRSGSTWSQQIKLFASDSSTGDQFGHSVAIDGDYAIVGAPNNDTTGYGGPAGAAYLYYKNEGGLNNWGEQKKFWPTVGGTSVMGHSVDIEGSRAVCGSYSEPTGGGFPYIPSNTGAAYIYTRSGIVWSIEQKITASDSLEGDQFGYSVALSGDYILVGANLVDSLTISDAGAVYAFLYNGSTWTEQSKTFSSVQSTTGGFGFDVGIDGDYSIVGMPQEVVATDSGKAFIYESINDLSLPVYLTDFNAISNYNGIELNWKTESEIENQGFIVERAESQYGFYSEIASYKNNLNLIGQSNSSTGSEYSYIDNNVESGNNYWYKLYDVNLSGVKTLHGPINVTTDTYIVKKFELFPAYPNPFNPKTTIRYNIPENIDNSGSVSLIIYNTLGQKIKILDYNNTNSGNQKISWNGDSDSGQNVASGIYYLVMDWKKGQATQKLLLIR